MGELVLAAIDAGASRIVVGLGGSGSNDGGAGFLAALGAYGDRRLDGGVAALDGVQKVEIAAARERIGDVELVAATDVDNQLTGLLGATRNYGPQKGISEVRLPMVDTILSAFAGAVDRKARLQPGAGAAGGLGYGLLVLGATRESGIELVADVVGLAERAAKADLVLTGEGPSTSPAGPARCRTASPRSPSEALRPCVAIAGQVQVGAREMRATRRRVGVLPRVAGGGGAGVRRPVGRRGRPGRPRGAHLVPLRRVSRSGTQGITPHVRPLERLTTAPRSREQAT